MFHGWRFDPDGDHLAADSTRSSTSLGTGSSVNPRTARRLVTASYTSIIACLTTVSFLTISFNTILIDTIPDSLTEMFGVLRLGLRREPGEQIRQLLGLAWPQDG